MDVDTALRTADYDRGNGPKSVALDVLAAEVRRLRQGNGELLVKGVKLDQALGRSEAEVRRLREIEQRARDVYDGRAEWTPGNGAQAEFASDIARHILGDV